MSDLCANCGRSGRKGCCVYETIVLTREDVQRIRSFLPESIQFYDICDLTSVQNERVARWADGDPAWLRLVSAENGNARVLKTKQDGLCWFLEAEGCCLPMHVKPLVCRLYPYDRFSEFELPEYPLQEDVNCPPELFVTSKNVAELIGVCRSDVEKWHAQLYKEINEEAGERK